MNALLHKRVIHVWTAENEFSSWSIIQMGTVTDVVADVDDDGDDCQMWEVTFDGDDNKTQHWTPERVRIGIELHERSIALRDPERNLLHERVALEVFIGGNTAIVFGRVNGRSGNLWTVKCDLEHLEHRALESCMAEDGIRRFRELKEFAKEECRQIELFGRRHHMGG